MACIADNGPTFSSGRCRRAPAVRLRYGRVGLQLRVNPSREQTSVFGELPCQDEGTAVAEADHAAPRQDPLPSDPVILPRDAVAHGEIGLTHDLDTPKLDRFGFPDSHGASPFGVR